MSPVVSTLGGASQFGYGRSAKISILRPSITAPSFNSEQKLYFTITASSFVFTNGLPSTAHQSTDWQIASDNSFTNIIVQSLDDTTNKTSFYVREDAGLQYATVYYIRVRYRDNSIPSGVVSDWSSPLMFTTIPTPIIATPTILSPTENSFETNSYINISASNFSIPGVNPNNETFASSRWQVATDSSFTNIIFDGYSYPKNTYNYNLSSGQNVTFTTTESSGDFNYIELVGIKAFPENLGTETIYVNGGTYLIRHPSNNNAAFRVNPSDPQMIQMSDSGPGGDFNNMTLRASVGTYTTMTSPPTSVVTSSVSGGTKYIRVRYIGSLGTESQWSPTRTITIAWAETGPGLSTFYPNSTTFVVPYSKDVTLQPGAYRITLYGAGGGAAAGGSLGSREGGSGSSVSKDIYFSTASRNYYRIGTGGRASTGYNQGGGAGGDPGGGAGGSSNWSGGGGGGYTEAFDMKAGGGGGAAGDGLSNGRNAYAGFGFEYYGNQTTNKIYLKGCGFGGIAPRQGSSGQRGDGRDGPRAAGGGGGAGVPDGGGYTSEQIQVGGGAILESQISFNGQTFSNKSTGDKNFNWSNEFDTGVSWQTNGTDYGGSSGWFNSNIRIEEQQVADSDNRYNKRLSIDDMYSGGYDGPTSGGYGDLTVTARVGFFYHDYESRVDFNSQQIRPDGNLRYYYNRSFTAGEGGSNLGSFHRSTLTNYYYNYGGYNFGQGGRPQSSSTDPNWHGKPGGAVIERLSGVQNPPIISITSDLISSASFLAGNGQDFTIGATDTNNGTTPAALRYEWYLSTDNGASYNKIDGAGEATFKRFRVTYFSDNGHKFYCRIIASNSAGTSYATSNICTLSITRRSPERIDPVLPRGTNVDAFEWNTSGGQDIWPGLSNFREVRSIPSGFGKVRIKLNSTIKMRKY